MIGPIGAFMAGQEAERAAIAGQEGLRLMMSEQQIETAASEIVALGLARLPQFVRNGITQSRRDEWTREVADIIRRSALGLENPDSAKPPQNELA